MYCAPSTLYIDVTNSEAIGCHARLNLPDRVHQLDYGTEGYAGTKGANIAAVGRGGGVKKRFRCAVPRTLARATPELGYNDQFEVCFVYDSLAIIVG